jgi:hypothetical protein
VGVVWNYDGGSGGTGVVSVQFPSVNGITYKFSADVSGTLPTVVGDGGTKTLTISDLSFGSNPTTSAILYPSANTSLAFKARLFSNGSAGIGFSGISGASGASAGEGIRIAFTSSTYETSPVWVRLDDPSYPNASFPNNQNVVTAWTSDRGRQYELDKTQAGTATITLEDPTGVFDPTNKSGPFFGNIGPLAQAKITVQNPVDGSYHDMFTGFVESWDWTFADQSARLMLPVVNLTDGFELLSRAEVVPDSTGTTTYVAQQVDDRINAVLNDAGWPASWRNIFTGNVDMQQTVYNPQTSTLAVMQDAADAEFPNVANVFMDRWGQVAFRGRWSRLNPANYETRDVNANPQPGSKQIIVWNVGDRNAAQTFGYAPISDIEWTLDLKNVINACLCMPYNIVQNLISANLKTDPTSINQYGTRVLSIPDLLITSSIVGPVGSPFPATQPGGDGVNKPASDSNGSGVNETAIFGQYFVDNYKNPVEMISKITFQTIPPNDSLGPAWWKFVTGVEIGDIVIVTETNPGGGGFKATQFFVEGIHNQVSVGYANVPQWTMNLDLSPRSWYSKFDGVTYFTP